MNTNLLAAKPVSQDLLRKIIAQSGYKNRNDLWIRILDHFTNARLHTEIRIRIGVQIARTFGMKTNYVTGVLGAKLGEATHWIFIKLAFLGHRISSGHKEWRIHRPPTHDE